MSAGDIDALFDEFGLPRPKRVGNNLQTLERKQLVARGKGRGAVWRPTPRGRSEMQATFSNLDVARLLAQTTSISTVEFADTVHPVIPPSLAPPDLLGPVARFLDDHPFDQNVFGMTRFPSEAVVDPVATALEVAREACKDHGLEFHLASDRAIVDDLWANVAAYMWASRYGIAFFEDRAERGINLNLTIEVGSMLMTGRRVALMKDATVPSLPTDLVGKLYKPVNLDDADTVLRRAHAWLADDLGLGRCANCPK